MRALARHLWFVGGGCRALVRAGTQGLYTHTHTHTHTYILYIHTYTDTTGQSGHRVSRRGAQGQ